MKPGDTVEWIGADRFCMHIPLIRRGERRKLVSVTETHVILEGHEGRGIFGWCDRRDVRPLATSGGLKPNGHPIGTFMVTIDDGYVAYRYPLSIDGMNSISSVWTALRAAFNAPHADGKIVTDRITNS